MQYDVFPEEYKQKVTQDRQIQEQKIKDKHAQSKVNIEKEVKANEDKSAPAVLLISFSTPIVGAILGVLACTNYNRQTGKDGTSILLFFGVSIGFYILVMLVSSLIAGSKKSAQEKIDELMAEEDLRYNEELASVEKNAYSSIREYKDGFENEVRHLSVKFAESRVALQIISLMTTEFVNSIRNAPRGAFFENISESYDFSVFKDQIKRKQGDYFFYSHRCKDLNSALEQAALARAIASSVQQNIMMEFPTDPSGTIAKTDIHYTYGTNYVSAIITYSASNGNYTAGMNW